MTAAILTRLPLEAGGAVLASTGRAVHSALAWGFAHYMRAPLASTGIAAMVTLGLVASSNALYFQHQRHPAPMFGPALPREGAVDPSVRPVTPVMRPAKQPVVLAPKVAATPAPVTTGSIPAQSKPIGNAEVFQVQRKLAGLELFEGEVDGFYGPKTARSIRTFEERNGLKPTGQLTPEIINAILEAPLGAEPVVVPLPTPDPLPKAAPVLKSDPLAQVITSQPVPEPVAAAAPLPAPEPLAMGVGAKVQLQPVAEARSPRRDLPDTPQEAMNIAVETAGDAIDTIIEGVQTLAQTTPGKSQPKAATPAPLQVAPAADKAPLIANAGATPVTAPQVAATGDAVVKPVEVAVLDTDAKIEDLMPPFSVTDPVIVSKVQRGLASLGFLHGPIDGVPGEATAKAIRTFETFYNYERTGRITPELPDLLVKAGATL